MLARRNLGEGGSIARRRSPGRRRRRARRAAVAFHVVGNMLAFSAPSASPRGIRAWGYWFLFRPLALRPMPLGLIAFALKFSGPKCLFRVQFQLLRKCHVDPLRIPKTLNNPSNCCYLRLLAATCQPNHEKGNILQPPRQTRCPTTAAHLVTRFQQFTLFPFFQLYFQMIAARPTTSNLLSISHLQPEQPPLH